MEKVMIKMDFSKFRYEAPELLFESEDEDPTHMMEKYQTLQSLPQN